MRIIYIMFAMGILLSGACNQKLDLNHDHSEEEGGAHGDHDEYWISQRQFNSSDFQIGELSLKKFSEFITVSGDVHVPERNRAGVSSLMGGKVSSFDWIEGQWVTKGQVLLTITNPDLVLLQESYLLLKENNQFLTAEYDRIKSLADKEITARKNFLKIATDLNANKVKMTATGEQLQMYGIDPVSLSATALSSSLSLSAPISGYITEINTLQGSYIEAGTNAIAIANNHHIHLELSILERDIPKIRKGQKVQFFTRENYEDTLHAEVHLVDALLGEDQFLKIHCHIEKPSRKNLKPGMYATANIIISEMATPALPEEAIVEIDEDYFVLAQVTKRQDSLLFEKIPITVGTVQNGFVAIENDVVIKDRKILTSGAFFLLSESGGGHSH